MKYVYGTALCFYSICLIGSIALAACGVARALESPPLSKKQKLALQTLAQEILETPSLVK